MVNFRIRKEEIRKGLPVDEGQVVARSMLSGNLGFSFRIYTWDTQDISQIIPDSSEACKSYTGACNWISIGNS